MAKAYRPPHKLGVHKPPALPPGYPHGGDPTKKPGLLATWKSKLLLALSLRVPAGYEDDTGFYFGVEPAQPPDQVRPPLG